MIDLLDIIKSIEAERREAKRQPICALFVELLDKCSPEQRTTLKNDLNKLYEEGKIRVWRTINDKAVQSI